MADKLTLRPGQKNLCPDCVYRNEEDRFLKYIKHHQYFCNFKDSMVVAKKECCFHINKYLKERREKEAPQEPVRTEDLLKRLEELMLAQAFDNVSGTITLHSSYSHMSEITLYLGPPPKHRHMFICSHCLHQAPLIGDMVDIDKLYCPKCYKHTEPYYNDEV